MRNKIRAILKNYLRKSPYEKWIIYKEDIDDITIDLEELFIKELEAKSNE